MLCSVAGVDGFKGQRESAALSSFCSETDSDSTSPTGKSSLFCES